jgi:hypothetical protein
MSSRVAVGSCGSYLVFLIAQRDVEFGLLSLKLKAIRDCLNPSFEQLDAALAADDVQQKAGECPASSMPLFSTATVNIILESNSEISLFVASLCVLFQSEDARVHPAFCACQCLAQPLPLLLPASDATSSVRHFLANSSISRPSPRALSDPVSVPRSNVFLRSGVVLNLLKSVSKFLW